MSEWESRVFMYSRLHWFRACPGAGVTRIILLLLSFIFYAPGYTVLLMGLKPISHDKSHC